MKLSIIIPCYNEKKTILEILNRVKNVKLDVKKEIIIVDDFSNDGTRDILKKLDDQKIKIVYHSKNMGKGHAIRTGLKHAKGEIIIIQDADLEYNPKDYSSLIKPIMDGRAQVVYGSRNLRKNKRSYFSFYLGGILLSRLANILYGTKITDESTGYKVFRSEIIKNMDLRCERFEFCPEISAKIAKKGIKIHEVPISYNPRKKRDGKKIGRRDGAMAIWTLIKYRFI